MKIIAICAVILISNLPLFGQAKIEIQIGGSNFYGMTINSAYDIPVSKNHNRFLSPSFGVGLLLPSWDGPTSIIHVGLDYTMNKFSIGCELSNFLPSPFGERDGPPDVDLIVYPNVSYTYTTKANLYFNLSAGAYFAYSDSYNYSSGQSKLDFQGDVIPGVGITTGYKF